VSRRPNGFTKFIKREGFHSVILAEDLVSGQVYLHQSIDPKQKLTGSKVKIPSVRIWWLAGKHISSRISKGFTQQFYKMRNDNGAYNLPFKTAEQYVNRYINELNTWSASENDMIHLMDLFNRRKDNRPANGATFLAGITKLPPLDSPSVLRHFDDGFMQRVA